ncbi:alpha/beta hydrolase [Penicillium atrosanguineum]|uniref:alpha/beta hydrolase n=1 Tax=Penicillium atrosanguineum TaxID=1132637 RepID=UPI00238FF6D0|nr:alpha/beta hydrolase [Penicillium atrosanguineum]KAJ5304403.1 alpha/beta hydrolase [Penicillium atrosanguineum]
MGAASVSFDALPGENDMAAAGPSTQTPDLPDYSEFMQFLSLPDSFDMSVVNESSVELRTPKSLNSMSSTQIPGPQLSQRERSLQQGSLTGKLLLGRLTVYTRMMADPKTLPPFIHPPCSLDSNDECPPDLPHQCLPEALAVCANLTKMFYSNMQGSHSFAWKQICTHLRQMSEEVSLEFIH